MNTGELVDQLASHRTLGGAPRTELRWLAERGSFHRFTQGEVVSRQTEILDSLYVLLSGRIGFYMNRGAGVQRTMEWRAGDVTGVLPYSRMTNPPGDAVVEEPTDVLRLHRADFPDLIRACPEVTSLLVHVMTDRARRFTSTELRDEKMIALGRLAAGFAHELNNPASAAVRSAKSLVATLATAEEAARSLLGAGLTAVQLSALDALWRTARPATPTPPPSGLALADREDEIGTWLREQQVPQTLAGELARTSLTRADLAGLGASFRGPVLEAALLWITGMTSSIALGSDIERAAARIHDLVAAAKGFTRVDRAPVPELFDLGPGIVDTATLLKGKARAKSVEVALAIPEDLPPLRGYAVEINQVWMNLLDNAIDAAPHNGHVSLSAVLEGADVFVSVIDDGPGVPAEIQDRIFDPFFTTKPVGVGTGLGLEITRRIVNWHNGTIVLDSRPGRTEFRVRLPLGGP